MDNKKIPIIGGVITAICTGLGIYLVGNLSGYQAMDLIGASLPRISSLFNTIILASSTILALLLTLLSLSSATDSKLKKSHYSQVLTIARYGSVLFIVTLILFQLLNIPIVETEGIPTSWYTNIYWISLFASALVSGFMVVVILMLYNTISDIIYIVGFKKDHPLIENDDS